MTVKSFQNIPLSVLDLSPINEGSTPTESFKNSVDLAQHVDRWGFNRYWLAEHHNMPGIGSSATSVLIGHIAGATERIRVGSGGIMLPNHAALVIAEQFGTLESLYPGRIDLGLGRAPGSDHATAYALRRTLNTSAEQFPEMVQELESYFAGTGFVHAHPGEGLDIPIWLLGSSDFSARLAARTGKRFSFASHFSNQNTMPAIRIYRDLFEPSGELDKPYVMLGVNVIAAETAEKARWLATSQQQQMFGLIRGKPGKFQPPIDENTDWNEDERFAFEQSLSSNSFIIGTPDQVKEQLTQFIEETKADEIIINSPIYHHEDRIESYKYLAEMMQ
ncbi:LLM class flavin-dependent oxidoreductase [Chungangia koreensis]|uniref:LLM class flavin-dependent oxidoreductase n=1 Tax=Chungangia koreensis TaxID=752657 RepID=A0ABV8X071_9LACT